MAAMDYWKVFFYIPNLIGYFRVFLSAASFYWAFRDWKKCLACYVISFVCDYFDGLFARLFNQCTKFGAVLDMVTDRCSTAGLLFVLSHLYKDYTLHFLFLVMLDFSSHWYHMTCAKEHHKMVRKDQNVILRAYYGIYPFFGYCCVGTELFYILLYVTFHNPNLIVSLTPTVQVSLINVCRLICFPACICKNICNIAQLCSAAATIAEEDKKAQKKIE